MENEANALRLRILNVTLLIGVAVGGMAFVRTLFDAIELEAWTVVAATVIVYAVLVVLLFARRLSYAVRASGALAVLYVAGVFGLLAAGYLPAPILILVSQNILAAVFFGRRATWAAFVLNLLALLAAGLLLSSGLMTVETTTFYDPTDFIDWLRVTTVFAVFAGMAIVSVDVLTRHLDESLQEQAELIENLKGATQLHDESERHRRDAENRLREATGRVELDRRGNDRKTDVDARLKTIATMARSLRSRSLTPDEAQAVVAEIEKAARPNDEDGPPQAPSRQTPTE